MRKEEEEEEHIVSKADPPPQWRGFFFPGAPEHDICMCSVPVVGLCVCSPASVIQVSWSSE